MTNYITEQQAIQAGYDSRIAKNMELNRLGLAKKSKNRTAVFLTWVKQQFKNAAPSSVKRQKVTVPQEAARI